VRFLQARPRLCRNAAARLPDRSLQLPILHQHEAAIMTEPSTRIYCRRYIGAALLALAIGGAVAATHALALSELRLAYAVLLVQGLALAAVTGVALLAVPAPGLARRATPKA
jgi:hypothetical protein